MNPELSRELAAENIAVRFAVGILFITSSSMAKPGNIVPFSRHSRAGCRLCDRRYCVLLRHIFLRQWLLAISCMERLFIAMLCYYHPQRLKARFAITTFCRSSAAIGTRPRHLFSQAFTVSELALYFLLPSGDQQLWPLLLTLVILGWVTGGAALSSLPSASAIISASSMKLKEHRTQLEAVSPNTRELQERRHMLHQERWRRSDCLRASHEVGNAPPSFRSFKCALPRSGWLHQGKTWPGERTTRSYPTTRRTRDVLAYRQPLRVSIADAPELLNITNIAHQGTFD